MITTRIRPARSTKPIRRYSPRTTSLGTGLAFTAVRVVGAPKGCRCAFVTTHEGRRYAVRMDPREHLWRVDLAPSFGPSEVAVPGYFTSPELAAGVLEIRLRHPAHGDFALTDVRRAILEIRAGHTVPSPIFDGGSCALRAAL